jgi:hypothetical protein
LYAYHINVNGNGGRRIEKETLFCFLNKLIVYSPEAARMFLNNEARGGSVDMFWKLQ